VKTLVKDHWTDPGGEAAAKYEQCLRDAAIKQGLTPAQTAALVQALHNPQMSKEIADT
jgi:hypothetical protein